VAGSTVLISEDGIPVVRLTVQYVDLARAARALAAGRKNVNSCVFKSIDNAHVRMNSDGQTGPCKLYLKGCVPHLGALSLCSEVFETEGAHWPVEAALLYGCHKALWSTDVDFPIFAVITDEFIQMTGTAFVLGKEQDPVPIGSQFIKERHGSA
jgi:hypothetical protein